MNRVRRPATLIPLIALVALLTWAVRADVPRLSGGTKGDEATYVAMAFSLAKDGDLKYLSDDYHRFVQLYGSGPEGVFLKIGHELRIRPRLGWPPVETAGDPVPWSHGLEFGKPFAYAVLAAPFAAAFGLGGLLALNILLLALCLTCAVTFARARLGPVVGVVAGAGFVAASIAPVYGVWLTPEIFNFTLVFVAYFLWLYKKVAPSHAAWLGDPRLDWVAALLLGIATFSKPTHGLLIAPLVLDALTRLRWRQAVALSALFVVGSAGLYGVNALISGELNYQGGDRKSFYTNFPFDGKTAFAEAGNTMTTNQANDVENDKDIFAPGFMFPMLRYNSWYFLVGRDAGFLPYFFPGLLIVLAWLVRWRQSTLWQWSTAAAAAGTALVLLIIAPESWNGGGGPVGNRYFLSIYPAFLFLVPAGFGMLPAVAALVIGLTFVGPILVQPFAASRPNEGWRNPERWPLRLLPIELTIMNQLPVRLNPERGRIPVSRDPEVFLYYMDGRTYFQEKDGFWVAPGTAEIVIRTEHPLSELELRVRSPITNDVRVSLGDQSAQLQLAAGAEQAVILHPAPGVHAFPGYQVVLAITTTHGFYPRDFDPSATDTRHLGAFITPTYRVTPATTP